MSRSRSVSVYTALGLQGPAGGVGTRSCGRAIDVAMPGRAVMLDRVALLVAGAACPHSGKPHLADPQLCDFKPHLEAVELLLHRLQCSFHLVMDRLPDRGDEIFPFLLVHWIEPTSLVL